MSNAITDINIAAPLAIGAIRSCTSIIAAAKQARARTEYKIYAVFIIIIFFFAAVMMYIRENWWLSDAVCWQGKWASAFILWILELYMWCTQIWAVSHWFCSVRLLSGQAVVFSSCGLFPGAYMLMRCSANLFQALKIYNGFYKLLRVGLSK